MSPAILFPQWLLLLQEIEVRYYIPSYNGQRSCSYPFCAVGDGGSLGSVKRFYRLVYRYYQQFVLICILGGCQRNWMVFSDIGMGREHYS